MVSGLRCMPEITLTEIMDQKVDDFTCVNFVVCCVGEHKVTHNVSFLYDSQYLPCSILYDARLVTAHNLNVFYEKEKLEKYACENQEILGCVSFFLFCYAANIFLTRT